MVALEQRQAFLALALHTLAVVAVQVILLAVLAVLVVAVQRLVALVQQTEVAVAVALLHQVLAAQAALVLSFFQYQHHDTQAQPQAHQQSQQAVQTQF
jgi:hypothetical protein